MSSTFRSAPPGSATAAWGPVGLLARGLGAVLLALALVLTRPAAPVLATSHTFSINDVTVTEGDAGTTLATFTVTLSVTQTVNVTVDYATADGTATAGTDYTAMSGTLLIPAGLTTGQITVPVIGDTLDEVDETFFVNLTNPSAGGTILDGQGLGTITDDDAPPTVSINDVTVTEGDTATTTASFTVSLSAASGKPITVDYGTANGAATGGSACGYPVDYLSQSGTLSFVAGDTSKPVAIDVCGDTTDEFDETYTVNLSNPTNATISDAQGLGTITDDDAPPTVSINDVTVTEGDTATTTASFTVSLSAASGKPITVDYGTANGTATGGSACGYPVDYLSQSGTLSFVAGDTSKPVAIDVCSDTTDEFDETYTVNLSNPTNATISDAQGLGTITDDDAPPTATLDIDRERMAERGGTAVVTVTLAAISGKDVTVTFTFSGSAGLGVDYTASATSVLIPAGSQQGSITLATINDGDVEGDESVVVSGTADNATFTDGEDRVWINDDDNADAPAVEVVRTQTLLTLAPAVGTQGGWVTLTATLTADGTPLDGRLITFSLAGQGVGAAETDIAGAARLPADISRLGPGLYGHLTSAEFAGEEFYTGSWGDNGVDVLSIPVAAPAPVGTPALVEAPAPIPMPMPTMPPISSEVGAPFCAPGQTPVFLFGFGELKEQIGEVMGEPTSCEYGDPNGTGDTLQDTTAGLSFYRRSTNTPTFTNGWDHWALTAEGLVYWTGESIDPPSTAGGV